ncbi:Syntaxin-72 [Diplonema papillatum]|nr:Syntaxin-72 [Diplonema papillatum]
MDAWQVSLSQSMRSLRKVANGVGLHPDGEDKKPENEVDTSKMTAYEKKQYQCAELMCTIRADVAALDRDGKGSDRLTDTGKISLKNRVRKNLGELKQTVNSTEMSTAAAKERKPDELAQLRAHFKTTEKMWRQRQGFVERGNDEKTPLIGRDVSHLQDVLDRPSGGGGGGGGFGTRDENVDWINPEEDPQFEQFYVQARERDQEIDIGLHRVYESLGRIKNHALVFSDEIERQTKMLEDVNVKAETTAYKLKSLNKRLKTTIDEVHKSNICIYLICVLLLLGIVGVIYSQSK